MSTFTGSNEPSTDPELTELLQERVLLEVAVAEHLERIKPEQQRIDEITHLIKDKMVSSNDQSLTVSGHELKLRTTTKYDRRLFDQILEFNDLPPELIKAARIPEKFTVTPAGWNLNGVKKLASLDGRVDRLMADAVIETQTSLSIVPLAYRGQPSASDMALEDALRNWRRVTARQEKIPSYIILLDKRISDLVVKRPRTLQDLEDVSRLTSAQIAKYGTAILELIRQHAYQP